MGERKQMSTYVVNFYNKNSGWLHNSTTVVADSDSAAVQAARAAFDNKHGFQPAHADENGNYVASSGTPGYDSGSYNTSVVLQVASPLELAQQQFARGNATPVEAPPLRRYATPEQFQAATAGVTAFTSEG
jgi:hypothetical protein